MNINYYVCHIFMKSPIKQTLEKTEWTLQRHWQHWVHKTKTNKAQKNNKIQKTKPMSNMDHQKQGENPQKTKPMSNMDPTKNWG